MKKKSVLCLILCLVFLVTFNFLFFVTGNFIRKLSVWISYGLIHLAYIMLFVTNSLGYKGKKLAIINYSIYLISFFYFFLELFIGAAFILVSFDKYIPVLLIQFVLAGIYVFILTTYMIANKHTIDEGEKQEWHINYIKKTSIELKSLILTVSDKEIKEKIEKVYDALYSSPAKSNPTLLQVESQIMISIISLKEAVSLNKKTEIITLAESLLLDINQRNSQLRLLN